MNKENNFDKTGGIIWLPVAFKVGQGALAWRASVVQLGGEDREDDLEGSIFKSSSS